MRKSLEHILKLLAIMIAIFIAGEPSGILLNCSGFFYVYLALYHSYIELPYDKLIINDILYMQTFQ
jgi:hypothetical protein